MTTGWRPKELAGVSQEKREEEPNKIILIQLLKEKRKRTAYLRNTRYLPMASTEGKGVVCTVEKGIMGRDEVERPEALNKVC